MYLPNWPAGCQPVGMTTDGAHSPTPSASSPASPEVVITGAGFAGLQAAQVLGRARRRVLLLDGGPPRNAASGHAHNVLTRDGTPPGELVAAGQAEVDALPSVSRRHARVDRIARDADGLSVVLAAGTAIRAPAVLLATGVTDELPPVPGLAELWGTRAHVCPFCDAYAYADRRLLVLQEDGPMVEHRLRMLRGWTDDLVVRTPQDVTGLSLVGDRVHVDGPQPVVVDGVFTEVRQVPQLAVVEGLAPRLHNGFLLVDPDAATSVPGLWAAGDATWIAGARLPGGQVVQAMGQASRAAAGIVLALAGIDLPPAAPHLDPVSP